MSVQELLSYLNTTAMVLGYILLALFLAGVVWFAGTWAETWRYKRNRRRRQDREWDQVRSVWLDEMYTEERHAQMYDLADRIETEEHPKTVVNSIDRIDTEVMHATFDQIVHYQKENTPHDAS